MVAASIASTSSPPRRRYFGFLGAGTELPELTTPPRRTAPLSPPPQQQSVRVPWLEVNTALGHACLLLKTIQELSSNTSRRRRETSSSNHIHTHNHSKMTFTHELYPMGTTSKIGIRFEDDATTVLYNLFYEDSASSSFASASAGFGVGRLSSFFQNKNMHNFNLALQAFVHCVAEAAQYQHQQDKTLSLPHPIRQQTTATNTNTTVMGDGTTALNGGEWTIGGLSMCYPSAAVVAAAATGRSSGNNTKNSDNDEDGVFVDWTRACKYLLTDLKWLVAYTAKHVQR